MTTTYNKRPATRGKVYKSAKAADAPMFVEWLRPKSAAARVMLTIVGIVPFLVLFMQPWLQFNFEYLSGETVTYSLFDLFSKTEEATVIDELTAQLTFHEIFGLAGGVDGSEAEPAYLFSDFKLAFIGAIVIAGVGLLLLINAIVNCKKDSSVASGYLGFVVLAAVSVWFVAVVIRINGVSETTIIQSTPFPFIALVANLVALVYCVRYPSMVEPKRAKGKKNNFIVRKIASILPVKGDAVPEGARKAALSTALVCLIFFGATLGADLIGVARAAIMQNFTRGLIGAEVDFDSEAFARWRDANRPKPLPDYLALWELNNDVIGYIRLGDTKIDYPVLQTTCNNYYMDFGFDHTLNKGGAIFADYRNVFDGLTISPNTILYGHNISSGDYFSQLSRYHMQRHTLEFYRKNPVVMFDTLYEKMEWKVFAAVLFNSQPAYGEVIRYWDKLDFDNEADFHDYMLTIMDRSVLFTDVDLQYGDHILTLSTCYYPYSDNGTKLDTRIVIFARRVRPGESSEVDVSKAKHNPGVLQFEQEAKIMGRTWSGRTWDTSYLIGYEG